MKKVPSFWSTIHTVSLLRIFQPNFYAFIMHVNVAVRAFLHILVIIEVNKANGASQILVNISYIEVNVGSHSLFDLFLEKFHVENLIVIIVKQFIVDHCLQNVINMLASYGIRLASNFPIHAATASFSKLVNFDVDSLVFLFLLNNFEMMLIFWEIVVYKVVEFFALIHSVYSFLNFFHLIVEWVFEFFFSLSLFQEFLSLIDFGDTLLLSKLLNFSYLSKIILLCDNSGFVLSRKIKLFLSSLSFFFNEFQVSTIRWSYFHELIWFSL